MKKVFVCHASEDKPIAIRIADELKRSGIHAWIDVREILPGDSLRTSIEQGLDSSDYALVLYSKHAHQKSWVQAEISAAFTKQMDQSDPFIIPVILDNQKLPLMIRDRLYVDFSKDFTTAFDLLLRGILRIDPKVVPSGLKTRSALVEIDLIDTSGKLMLYRKQQVLEALVSGVDRYTENFTSDGTLIEATTSPGYIEKNYIESGVSFFECLFDRPLAMGERLDRYFEAKWIDSFLNSKEYWEEKQHHPTEILKIKILFPRSRNPVRLDVQMRQGTILLPFDTDIEQEIENGRVVFSINIVKPMLYASYVVRWEW